jgi:hypothetical protein
MELYFHRLPEDLLYEICWYLRHNEVALLESLKIKINYEKLIAREYPAYYEILKVLNIYYPDEYKYDKMHFNLINKIDILQNIDDGYQYKMRTKSIKELTSYKTGDVRFFNLKILYKYCIQINKDIYYQNLYRFPDIEHFKNNYIVACNLVRNCNTAEDFRHSTCKDEIRWCLNNLTSSYTNGLDVNKVLLMLLYILYHTVTYYDKDKIKSLLEYLLEYVKCYTNVNHGPSTDNDIKLLMHYIESIL